MLTTLRGIFYSQIPKDFKIKKMMGVEIFDAAEGGSLQTSPVLEWMHASWAFQGLENLNLRRVDEVLEPGIPILLWVDRHGFSLIFIEFH